MAETMKATDAYSNFKKAVEALGDDKVALMIEALVDILDEDQLAELAGGINEILDSEPDEN